MYLLQISYISCSFSASCFCFPLTQISNFCLNFSMSYKNFWTTFGFVCNWSISVYWYRNSWYWSYRRELYFLLIKKTSFRISKDVWVLANIGLGYRLRDAVKDDIGTIVNIFENLIAEKTRSIQRTQTPPRLWPLTLSCDLDLKSRSYRLMSLDVAYCIVQPWYQVWCLWV